MTGTSTNPAGVAVPYRALANHGERPVLVGGAFCFIPGTGRTATETAANRKRGANPTPPRLTSLLREWVPICGHYVITRRTRCGIGSIKPMKSYGKGTLPKIHGRESTNFRWAWTDFPHQSHPARTGKVIPRRVRFGVPAKLSDGTPAQFNLAVLRECAASFSSSASQVIASG